MRRISKVEHNLLAKLHDKFPAVSYYMKFKIGLYGKLVSWMWKENYKYFIFITSQSFNTALFKHDGGVPDGYQIGKIVVHSRSGEKLHVEVNFVEEGAVQ